MIMVLVTGANGFIGKHLMEALGRRLDVKVLGYDIGTPEAVLEEGLRSAEVVFHLAGVNRPQNVEEFKTGNADFTQTLCDRILKLRAQTSAPLPAIVLASSIQAELDNPYGVSKREAEEALRNWSERVGTRVVIFRLKNVFGKWCRPNYNSVTATFCHNIAHDLPISISDPSRELDLVYIDDVVAAFLRVLEDRGQRTEDGRRRSEGGGRREDGEPKADLRSPISDLCSYREVPRSFKTTLGELAARIQGFRESRKTLRVPSLAEEFNRCLYATYLSYLESEDFSYGLEIRTDNRGCLAEFLKSDHFGQIFVSRTLPGITRGNHYHHTKTEKFLVVEGEAVVRFRSIQPQQTSNPQLATLNPVVIEHRVSGREFKVVDIPPGYTHSIENVGSGEMVCLFWASEIFDPGKPDTYMAPVQKQT
jgi:UDP-2-acetamido-2,6-beta-L-arabino-hexul-4-ose reductase